MCVQELWELGFPVTRAEVTQALGEDVMMLFELYHGLEGSGDHYSLISRILSGSMTRMIPELGDVSSGEEQGWSLRSGH